MYGALAHVGIIASPGLVKETKDNKNMAAISLTGIFSLVFFEWIWIFVGKQTVQVEGKVVHKFLTWFVFLLMGQLHCSWWKYFKAKRGQKSIRTFMKRA